MGVEGLNVTKTETAEPKAMQVEDFLPEHKAFARGILNVAEVTTLEEARNANWKFDGKYRSEYRTPESTNYTVTEKEGGEKEITPDINRKCTICHQRIKNVTLVSVNSQIVQMGRDCASKLMRFVDTGEMIAESSIKGIRGEQAGILVDILEDDENDIKKTERRKRRIVASMMSWLNDHANDEEIPEDIKYAIETYNNVGMMPNNDSAKKVAEYYKANRKFLPDEILDDNYLASFKRHIHARLLRGVARHGLVQNDAEQLKRIIDKGEELSKKRVERKLSDLEKEQIRQRLEAHKRWGLEMLNIEAEQRFRETELIHLETFFTKGLIEKGEFNQREFKVGNIKNIEVLKDRHGRYTIVNSPSGLKGRINSFYELETGNDNTRILKAYVLDQVVGPTHFDEKYFVIVDMAEEFVPKAYDPSKIDKINSVLNLGQFNDYPVSVIESTIEKSRVDMKFIRYSCAEVVMDRDTMKLVVKLSKGDVPLQDMIEQDKIIFTDDDGYDSDE